MVLRWLLKLFYHFRFSIEVHLYLFWHFVTQTAVMIPFWLICQATRWNHDCISSILRPSQNFVRIKVVNAQKYVIVYIWYYWVFHCICCLVRSLSIGVLVVPVWALDQDTSSSVPTCSCPDTLETLRNFYLHLTHLLPLLSIHLIWGEREREVFLYSTVENWSSNIIPL